ncbi:MAG: hypothetical protein C0501_15295 [Isosphaera sp.]|nr:hypothetical protein [Isosphaera sp.]
MLPSRRVFLLPVAAASLVLGAAAAWYLWPDPPAPPPEWAADYDTTARPPDPIRPGTVVGTTAPDGWSHLVIKSLPRVRPGEEKNIPPLARSQTVRMTRWLFTVFAADVRPETRGAETRHHLRAVGMGLGTRVAGRDVVLTLETAEEHGVELDWITRTILTKGYEVQRLARVVAHGPTFALVDAPVWYRCPGGNRLIRFRYALLVDAPTGRLDVLCWALDPGGDCTDPGAAVLLNPGQLDEAELVPDRKGFDPLGVASETAFGVDRLPPHRARVSLPPPVRGPAARTTFTPDEARALEAALRPLLP